MTNKDKYLKDGVSTEEFLNAVIEHCSKSSKNSIETFLKAEIKPTLTEDERVILRNIELNRYNKIGRKLGGALYLKETTSIMLDSTFDDFFNSSLFQFIKERRRI